MLVDWLESLWCLFCRHEWVRDRQKDGRLGLRCMKCMLRREHNLVRIIEWELPYTPIEPAHDSGFPPPLQAPDQD